MKTKLSLLLLLTFGFAFSANADISCEPMGLGGNWFCEELDAQNAQSFSWSTGSATPFTMVSCGLSTGIKQVSLTVTHTDGSTSTSTSFFHCQNFIY